MSDLTSAIPDDRRRRLRHQNAQRRRERRERAEAAPVHDITDGICACGQSGDVAWACRHAVEHQHDERPEEYR